MLGFKDKLGFDEKLQVNITVFLNKKTVPLICFNNLLYALSFSAAIVASSKYKFVEEESISMSLHGCIQMWTGLRGWSIHFEFCWYLITIDIAKILFCKAFAQLCLSSFCWMTLFILNSWIVPLKWTNYSLHLSL